MRIAVISKSDERGGGASVVASNLVRHYQKQGHQSVHFHLQQPTSKHPYGRFKRIISDLKWLEGRFGYRDHFGFETFIANTKQLIADFDVVHLHDMSTVFSHTFLGWLSSQIPTFWTIHDCSPFTAGCLYPSGCEGFVSKCGDCPQLGSWPLPARPDRTAEMLKRRKTIVNNSNLRFTAPSQWMIKEYIRAGHDRAKIDYVSNGVDVSLFKYRDKFSLRQKYGLAEHNGPVIMFSAAWLADSRKGPDLAATILRQCQDLKPKLMLVGRYSEEAAHIFQGLDIVHYGFVKNEAEKAEYFAMADIALMLSNQENAPLTVIEAMASGTAIFGFATGGVEEMMVDTCFDYIHSVDKIDHLQQQIRHFFHNRPADYAEQLSERCIARYSYEQVANRYIDLFESKSDKP